MVTYIHFLTEYVILVCVATLHENLITSQNTINL